MKAILVIDMPSRCTECPFHRAYADNEPTKTRCSFTAFWNEDGISTRADDCPLRPTPQKISPMEIYRNVVREIGTSKNIDIPNEDFCDGWNYCLDEILGETE